MAPPPQKECPVPSCDYKTPATLPNYELVYRDLDMHTKYHHINLVPPATSQATGESSTSAKADKLPRPELKEGATEADFIYFRDSWTRYKRSTGLAGQAAVDQLWACCSPELSRSVYDSGVSSSDDETKLLDSMKRLAVCAQNNLVNIVTFLGLGQDNEEPGGSFTARLKGQAAICDFTVKCSVSTCQNPTSYTDKMVAHLLVRGLVDPAIQEQVLAHAASGQDLSLDEIQKFVEAKEIGRRSGAIIAGASGLNRLSDYKGGKEPGRQRIRSNSETSSHEKCGWCGKAGHGARASREIREQKCKAFKVKCDICTKIGHYKEVCRRRKGHTNNNLNTKEKEEIDTPGTFCHLSTSVRKGRKLRTLPHHTYDLFRGWTKRKPESHPAVSVTMSLCLSGYDELDLPTPRVTNKQAKTGSLPDSGAQMVVAGPAQMHSLGVTKRELIPLSNGISTADNEGLGLLGGTLVYITGICKDGSSITTRQLCYIAEGIDCLFLSKRACRELGIIGDDFPTIGAHLKESKAPNLAAIQDATSPAAEEARPCDCPARTLPPPTPTALPFPATEANREKLENWIKEHYASSGFNQCTHQPLPLITSTPPLQLYVDPKARPVAVHKPVPVPLHWMKDIKDQLD